MLDDGPLNVWADVDEDRFAQVMANLLSNAAKFSFENTNVNIALKLGGGRIRIDVADQGPGIPEEFHSEIFGKFSRADNTDDRQQDGTGLGLAISKFIVEHHGGEIGFDTEIGVGTIFHFDLPVQD